MRIVIRVGDLVQKAGDAHTGRILGGRTIRRSDDVVCGLHHARENNERGFLVEAQNQGRQFVTGLASKPLGRFSPVCTQNRWRRFSPVWPQN
jgi:hypothetical protein